MGGTSAGAAKAKKTNIKKYGTEFYKNVGSLSWSNPDRSHATGFALRSPEERREAGRRGGQKTKKDYKTAENFVKENKNLIKEIAGLAEADQVGPGFSE